LVRRLIDEAVAQHNPDGLDELAADDVAQTAKLKCSGTHRGEWLGVKSNWMPRTMRWHRTTSARPRG
jgi:hypothetical protein